MEETFVTEEASLKTELKYLQSFPPLSFNFQVSFHILHLKEPGFEKKRSQICWENDKKKRKQTKIDRFDEAQTFLVKQEMIDRLIRAYIFFTGKNVSHESKLLNQKQTFDLFKYQ